MKGLDLGELPQLLFMKPNSTLSLEYLNATGAWLRLLLCGPFRLQPCFTCFRSARCHKL